MSSIRWWQLWNCFHKMIERWTSNEGLQGCVDVAVVGFVEQTTWNQADAVIFNFILREEV